jgi:hypothetical protein
MKTTSKLLTVLILALQCSSCVVSNTRTNQDASYQEHPKRIFVVANLEATGEGVTGQFYKSFSERITGCGGQTQLYKPRVATQSDALSLESGSDANDNKRFMDSIGAFAPDVILIMRVANLGVTAGYGQKLTAVVNSRLWDYRQKKSIWAGVSNMALGGMWATSEMRANTLSKDLAGKLSQGGLIPSCTASAR